MLPGQCHGYLNLLKFRRSQGTEELGTQTSGREFFVSRVGAKKTKSFCPDSRRKNTKTLREENREIGESGSFIDNAPFIATLLTHPMIKPIDRSNIPT